MGHSSKEQAATIAGLERRLKQGIASSNEKLSLAIMYLEPTHDECAAVELFESLLDVPECRGIVTLWLAYLSLHVFMDDASRARAATRLAAIMSSPDRTVRAGAHLLLAQLGRERGEQTSTW
jgi:hypothetical protein